METWLARLALLSAAAGFLSTSAPASAYLPWTVDKTLGGARVQWRSGSPAGLWDDATQTLTWRLNTRNFPAGNLPSVDEAGAALHNAFQSIEDIPGAAIRFRRGTNVAASPRKGDAQFHLYFHTGTGLDPYGSDISGIFAITYPLYNRASGTIADMDIFFNARASVFTWSTQAPAPPPGSNDIEVTLVHEALHAIGILHPVYYYAAVWPVGRLPELVLPDRCYSPDDRAAVRLLYPEAPLLGRITGTVTVGAGNADRAVVVAVDAAGVPQATIHTLADGTFDLSVPEGDYAVTAHHAFNSTYVGDIPFGGATPFVSAGTATGVVVSAGLVTPGADLACVSGVPSMKLDRIGTPSGLESQVQFLAPGASGTLRLAVRSSPAANFAAEDVASVDLGPGITASLGLVAPLSTSTTGVDVDYVVDGGAAPGVRALELVRTSGERLFLPAVHAVTGSGGLTIAAGPANPAPAYVFVGAVDQPVLQVRLAATDVEDVRVRRLAFDVAGSGPALPNVRLWRDANADGLVDPGDERILTSAAYALAVPEDQVLATAVFDGIGLSVPANGTVDLLLTFDLPAAGAGDYTVSLAAAGLGDQAHGMFYGDVVAPTGGATGGAQTLVSVDAGGLGQFEAPAGAVAIPDGGTTAQTSIVLRATASATLGQVGLDVELRPIASPLGGTPTQSSATTFASGSTIDLTEGGLASGTTYHWQARAVSSVLGPGPWELFGGFSMDQSTTTLGASLEQYDFRGLLLPVGGKTRSLLTFSAPVLNSSGFPVRLEVEIVPAGQAFADAATLSSPLVAAGGLAQAAYQGGVSGDFRWQARAVSQFGSASAWTDVGANGLLLDFHMNAGEVLEADGGCAASASRPAVPLLAAVLALAFLRRRRAAWLPLLLLMAAPAAADEPEYGFELSGGALLLDTSFEALRSDDLTRRELDGTGLAALGVEAYVRLGEDWRLGLAAEGALGGDVELLGAGPVLAWEFAEGHHLRAGALLSRLEIRESGFGDFEPALVPRAGYELRLDLGSGFAAKLGAEVRWSRFSYDEDVLSGDDTLGGAAVLLYIGLGWAP